MSNFAPRMTRLAIPLSLILSLSVGSCGGKKAEETPPPTPEAEAPAALSDANIAAIVVAANTADIKNGEAALAKTKHGDVKEFANRMITDHKSVNEQAVALVTKLGVTPEESPTSMGLVASTDSMRASIGSKSGAEFDKAYVDNEVTYHQAVLDMLDSKLIPGATNADLKELLEKTRPAFVAHLDHAKKLQSDLAK